jgi:hypothetical protein
MISQCHGPFIASKQAFLLWLGPHNITVITSKSACFHALLLFIDISTMDERGCPERARLRAENMWLPKIRLKGPIIKKLDARCTNFGFSSINQPQADTPALEAM